MEDNTIDTNLEQDHVADNGQIENQTEVSENTPQVEDNTEEVVEQEVKEPAVPVGIEKRFAKFTREKYEQQERIDALERQLQAKEQLANKPKREEYTDDEWVDQVAETKAKEMISQWQQDQDKNQQLQRQAQEHQNIWSNKMTKATEDIPDLVRVVSNADVDLPRDVIQTITSSEVGPQIAYHLAKNPEQAETLNYMDQRQRDRYITKLEIKLENTPTQSKAKQLTQAKPTPAPAGRGSTSKSMESLSIDDWMKQRNKQVGR